MDETNPAGSKISTLEDEEPSDRSEGSGNSDATVLFEEQAPSPPYSDAEKVSIQERVRFEQLLDERKCALCFRTDLVTVWCDRCHLAWCDEQCRINYDKYSPHSPKCLVMQKNIRVWQATVYGEQAPSAVEKYLARPFCMHCTREIEYHRGTECGMCNEAKYCSERCHLANTYHHFGLCPGMKVEQAKLTRTFDSVFHRDPTPDTAEILEDMPLDERIKMCVVVGMASGACDTYYAKPDDCYQEACRKFDFYISDPALCLDFCVADFGFPQTGVSESPAMKKMQRDSRKQVLLFCAKFERAILCLPKGQWMSRLDVEKSCPDCFDYVSAALLQTLGISWFTRSLDDIWIQLRARTSLMPCEPCLSVLPLNDQICG